MKFFEKGGNVDKGQDVATDYSPSCIRRPDCGAHLEIAE